VVRRTPSRFVEEFAVKQSRNKGSNREVVTRGIIKRISKRGTLLVVGNEMIEFL